jgi:hypothetical protein
MSRKITIYNKGNEPNLHTLSNFDRDIRNPASDHIMSEREDFEDEIPRIVKIGKSKFYNTPKDPLSIKEDDVSYHEEKCLICYLPPESHSFDFNID